MKTCYTEGVINFEFGVNCTVSGSNLGGAKKNGLEVYYHYKNSSDKNSSVQASDSENSIRKNLSDISTPYTQHYLTFNLKNARIKIHKKYIGLEKEIECHERMFNPEASYINNLKNTIQNENSFYGYGMNTGSPKESPFHHSKAFSCIEGTPVDRCDLEKAVKHIHNKTTNPLCFFIDKNGTSKEAHIDYSAFYKISLGTEIR